MQWARFGHQPQTGSAKAESGFIRQFLTFLISLILAIAVWDMWASPSLALVEIVPGGIESESPILQPLQGGCNTLDLGLTGGQTDFDPGTRTVRSRAEGELTEDPNVSFIEIQDRFIPTIPFPATVNASSTYLGRLRAFVAIDDFNQASARIEISLREFQTLVDVEGTIIDRHIVLNESITDGSRDIDSGQSDGDPNATFNVELRANRIYGVVLRLETRADGAVTDTAISDFFSGNRSASLNCVQIVPNLEDSDGDGIYDIWEQSGIDINPDDNVIDFDWQSLGTDYNGNPIIPDPNRKDIFVEVDYFNCNQTGSDCPAGDSHSHQPMSAVLDPIRQAFANAPVSNPDGNSGINLWVQVDEALPHQMNCDLNDGCFDDIKEDRFGTATERNNPATITAKKLIFRYNLWVHNKEAGNSSSGEADGGQFDGQSEISNGDDFVVSLGLWTAQVGTTVEQAGTFMHELGHTLGLGHGGGDEINCKPNYLSIMSYTFQTEGLKPANTFDYSRNRLPNSGSLPENDLNETIGIEDSTFETFYGPPVNADGIDNNGDGDLTDDFLIGQGTGPIDWDDDGNIENSASSDINFLEKRGCGLDSDGNNISVPGETLNGYDDWNNLKFNFRASQFFAEGVHGQQAVEELDAETAEEIKESIWRAQNPRLFEYSAKFICGKQQEREDMRLARGFYATTINIHNPNVEKVQFFKKLALTYPPAEQKPGEIYRIALDSLEYDEALAADCLDIKREVFDGEFPEPYIEGFLVIQSPKSLDVTGVYTTASLDKRGKVTEHSSIDVEQIRERVREPIKVDLPDLVPLAPFPPPPFDEEFGVQLPEGTPGSLFCAVNSPQGGASQSISVIVRNQGLETAGPSMTVANFFEVGEQVPIETPSLEPGKEVTLDFAVPQGCYNFGSCRFRLIVDAGNQGGVVTESNENNNVVESLCLAPAG